MIELPPIYGALALSRVGLQIGTAALERHKKHRRVVFPKATIVVPVYNEPVDLFIKAAMSFYRQDYPNYEVIVVDDGSDNRTKIEGIAKRLGFKYIYQENAGKREAMYNAFNNMADDSQVILNADSDTIWEKDAARHLVRCLLSDKRIGAVTGEVAVENEGDNLLTRLIAVRYHVAFLHERASQSFFGTVTCVSGPLGAYRREVIDAVKEDFINQRFFGKVCTYGDDRHLTNLVLNAGYKVRYAAKAKCYTHAPTEFMELVRQQTRWSKSYWREIFWQLRVLPKHTPYLTYDWLISFALPFLLALAIFSHIDEIVAGNLLHILLLPITILGMGMIRGIEPVIRTRRPIFLLLSMYAVIYFAVMLPSKFWALATINDGKWGTR